MQTTGAPKRGEHEKKKITASISASGSSTPAKLRVPQPVDHIQVNFCKNPKCPNFGVPVSNKVQPKGRPGRIKKKRDTYRVSRGDVGKHAQIICSLCGQWPTTKSNLGISEELERFRAYLEPRIVSCPDPECANHGIDVDYAKDKGLAAYRVHGKTPAGTPRFKCKACNTVFSAPSKPTLRRKVSPEKDELIFSLLMNAEPLKRICEPAGVTMPVIYDKIDFLRRQCLAFAASHESRLPRMNLHNLNLASDRQEYTLNWTVAKDKRNVILKSVGTADLTSGFIFALNVNYDASLNPEEVEKDVQAIGDYDLLGPFRKYARLWLQADYGPALERARQKRLPKRSREIEKNIKNTYSVALRRVDVEAPEPVSDVLQLPRRGAQVREEYTLYGHFFFLRKLLGGTDKVNFYLDQDSGIRAACLAAFADRVKGARCDAFFVQIAKGLTVDARKEILKNNKALLEELIAANPGMDKAEIRLMMFKRNMKHPKVLGRWGDKWVTHPYPNIAEPDKAVCHLTDIHGYSDDQLAVLFDRASLHAIDRFFMQVRRRLHLLERPLGPASNAGRRWYGYSPYNPEMVGKMLDIYRVFYNYVAAPVRYKKRTAEEKQKRAEDKAAGIKRKRGPGKKGATPAMRLGLMDRPATLAEIIGFSS